jgi:hypothetical protein
MAREKQKTILTREQISAIARGLPKRTGTLEEAEQRIASMPDETKQALKRALRLKLRADQLTKREAKHATRKN